jgi:amino acid adenylation domain-containing protein/non-ribosomal peptide synthase protein (TIGR01720 family)
MFQDLKELFALSQVSAERVWPDPAWSLRGPPYPRDRCIHEMIEEQARRTPEAVAVAFGDVRVSYRDLNGRANQLAHRLQRLGVGPEIPVALFMERSIELAVAVLALLKSGAVSVPLDPDFPRDRLAFMLEDTQTHLIVTLTRYTFALPPSTAGVVCVDELAAELAGESDQNPNSGVVADNLCTYYYTSGSTGVPKAVMMTHRVGCRLQWSHLTAIKLDGADKTLVATSVGYGFFLGEFASGLMRGATAVLARPGGYQDMDYLVDIVERESITVISFVPSVLKHYLTRLKELGFDRGRSLKHIVSHGEPLPADLEDALRASLGAKLHKFFGLTEAPVTAYWTGTSRELRGRTMAGRPTDMECYLLDPDMNPVAVGEVGEIYVGGPGMARGYMNRPGMTAERFLPNPFSTERGARFFRTGDFGRWLPEGVIELLGRGDDLVKLRGLRVELGEIEATLGQHPAVRDAAVVIPDEKSDDKRIVAYVVFHDAEAPSNDELNEFLARTLPEHMVPSAIIRLDALPLLYSGKINRKALAARARQSASYRAPRTHEERMLCHLFAGVLGLEQVGIDDHFFELGGHSLLATRLVSRVRGSLGVELGIRVLFEYPTVAELAERLQHAGKARESLGRRSRPDRMPLSPAQARLWFLYRLEGPSPTYNIALPLRCRGPLDVLALESAIIDVVARHESLRTVFPEFEGEPFQHVLPPGEARPPFTIEDVDEQSLPLRLVVAAATGIDLCHELPVRSWLFRVRADEHVLLLLVHHIAADGWSVGPLLQDLARAYEARSRGESSPFAELPVQYADYTLWQRDLLGEENEPSSVVARQLGFWRAALNRAPAELALPVDRPRPPVPSYQGGAVAVCLDARLHARLAELARAGGASVFMTIQAGFAALLCRLGAGDDIPLGSPIAGRGEHALEGLVGFFVNTLVLRTNLSGAPSFRELVDRVRAFDLAAYDHQDVPFERIVEALQPARSLARHPLFQVMLQWQNTPGTGPALAGLKVQFEPLAQHVAKFDLLLSLGERTGADGEPLGIDGRLEYSLDLFTESSAAKLVERFIRLLEAAVAAPNMPVRRLEILGGDERAMLLSGFNATARSVPDTVLTDLFDIQAQRVPAATAAVFGTATLTYSELRARANKLAHYLISLGVGPDVPVGICMDRSLELAVAVLGVLKAGGACVPLDPALPPQRLEWMLEDTRAPVIVTDLATVACLPPTQSRIVNLNVEHDQIASQSAESPRLAIRPDHLFYAIYTSGSTGRPKGIGLPHRALANLIHWNLGTLRTWRGMLQFASLGFDASFHEMFAAWCSGRALVLIPESWRRDATELLDFLSVRPVETAILPVVVLQQWAEHAARDRTQFAAFRDIVTTGEQLLITPPIREFFRQLPECVLHNHYGPSETHVVTALTFEGDPAGWPSRPSIGVPIWNTEIYILDDALESVPVGVTGELYIAGVMLARGYLNRPGLTAERFVADPHGMAPGGRMYRTGDKARWCADGTIEYLGRADQQMKIRGFRVEPAEIEAVLTAHPLVAHAAVVAREDGAAGLQLVAYAVPAPGASPALSDLRRHLAERLPEYMVPAAFVMLDALPLTHNGKLDRSALPAPQREGQAYRAPRSPSEEILCNLFAEILGLPRVGIDDHFFMLGGHSLMATRLISRARACLGVELAIRTIFEAPTVAELAERARRGSGIARATLTRRARPDPLPLSFAQTRLWFLARLEGPGSTYNVPLALRLEGSLDSRALEAALNDVVARHETLRTIFPDEGGVPFQQIIAASTAHVPLIAESIDETTLRQRLAEAASAEIAVEAELPVRAWLFGLARDRHVLLVLFHHIAADGWSTVPFLRDLSTAYEARHKGSPPDFGELPVQYADYALWQHELLGREDDIESLLAAQLAFWRQALAGAPEELELPSDRPRPAVGSHRGASISMSLDAELHGRLSALAASCGSSLFMVLQAGLAAFLSRIGAGDDIPIGSPVAGRNEQALEDLVGLFVNTLVLRTDVSGDPTMRELVGRVRQFALAAYDHQDIPFERVVDALQPARSLARHPLFQVMLVLQNVPAVDRPLAGLVATPEWPASSTAKFDLMFGLGERFGPGREPLGIDGRLEYSEDLFDSVTAVALAQRLVQFYRTVTEFPDRRLHELDIMDASERHAVLESFNATAVALPPATIPELFTAQVSRTPDAVAVSFEGAELTYAELDARATSLANLLRQGGVGPEVTVAVCLERSIELVVALYGILKAGGAYMPLDPDYPQSRLATMLADASPRCVLSVRALHARLPASVDVLLLDAPESLARFTDIDSSAREQAQQSRAVLPDHPAYVIYTSGSTGTPKGAPNTHRGLVNRILWMQSAYPLESGDCVLQKTPYSFDVSVWEFFWPLLFGARLEVAQPGKHRDPTYLIETIVAQRVTALHFVPSMLHAFLEGSECGRCSGLRHVICSGEALSGELQARFFARLPNVSLHNLYGPTEAAIDVTAWTCDPADGAVTPPIGAPIWNIRSYVLNDWLEPVPIGVAGELYLAGTGLARGYLRRPGLSAERFVADPYALLSGSRMYRTGDRARWRADGTLLFLGRADQQVKIRGLRIELGEIESALAAHPSVRQAAVTVREDVPGAKQLVAYIVPSTVVARLEPELQTYLQSRLPEYMVPSAFVVLDSLPLTTSGKLDRRNLPAPRRLGETFRPPRSDAEQILCRLYAEILGLDAVGIDDHFFTMGGDSILSIQLVSRARREGLDLSPRDVFLRPTIQALAAGARVPEKAATPAWGLDAAIGSLVATPIMRWWLEQPGPVGRFSQSMLVRVPRNLDHTALTTALGALLDCHHALRIRLLPSDDHGPRLCIDPPGSVAAADCLFRVDLSELADHEHRSHMEWAAEQAEDRLDPRAGRMIQAVWFVGAEVDRLLLIVHHLAVDGVSWRILIPDLASATAAAQRGRPPDLEPVGGPFKVWAQHLADRANTPEVIAELPEWEAIISRGGPIFPQVALDATRDVALHARQIRVALSSSTTAELLGPVPAAFHARVNDVLLMALALSVAKWRRERGMGDDGPILVNLEGHGREPLDGSIDLARTVGWFTSLYPVALDVSTVDIERAFSGDAAIARAIKQVKEQLRAVPGQGMGYGLLRYHNPEGRLRLLGRSEPQLIFNYLGRFDARSAGDWSLDTSAARLSSGVDPARPLSHLVEVNALSIDGPDGPCLSASWRWPDAALDERDIANLAEGWRLALESLATHARNPVAGGHTPSDFPLVRLSQEAVDRLENSFPSLEDILPLSPLQEGLLFHALYDESAPDVYNVQLVLTLEGTLDPSRLRAAARALLRRHANLRVAICQDGLDRPVQVVSRDCDIAWQEANLSGLDPETIALRRDELLAADRARRFAIASGPLLRATLVRLAPDRHLFVLTNHHILLDGWSMPIVLNELLTLYRDSGDPRSLPAVRPYADFLAWLAQGDHAAAVAAWRGYLAGLDGPTLFAAPVERDERSVLPDRWRTELSAELTAQLQRVARQRGLTLSTVMQGLWAILLGRLTGRDDVVFGVTVAGRPAELAGVEEMVGLFINTLPVRVRLRPQQPLADLLAAIQDSQSRLLPYQHLGLAEIQRLAGTTELFDTLVVFENYPVKKSHAGADAGLSVVGVSGDDATHYPLSLAVVPRERLRITIDFDPARCPRALAEDIGARFVRLLESAVASPEDPLHRLALLNREEHRRLTNEWAVSQQTILPRTFPPLFEAQVQVDPEAEAVVSGSESLSYGQLNERANRLAHLLIRSGVGPESVVGVCLERSSEMLVAVLAVMKAGGAYLPLDPAYPRMRLERMMAGSCTPVLSIAPLRDRLPEAANVLLLDSPETRSAVAASPAVDPTDAVRLAPLKSGHPAYVIYTSGSTGIPKGVVVTHGGIPGLAAAQIDRLGITRSSRVLQFASLNFDASLSEIAMALSAGAALVLPGADERAGPPLRELIKRTGVTHATLPPVVLATIDERDDLPLKGVIVAGEACPAELAARWSRNRTLINAYGPTETTVCATMSAPLSGAGEPPIGSPIASTRVYVLDQWLDPVPVGIAGELYVGGDGLARCYRDRPALTADRFVADPHASEPGSRIYRTGDKALWRVDGTLQFLGRLDDQVKIRGFRIEPGELERALATHADVAQAVAVARADLKGEPRLVAYVVLRAGASPSLSELRRHLAAIVPEYLMPASFVMLDAIPMTSSGKVDRRALPKPTAARPDVETRYLQSESPTEAILTRAWCDVLGLERVGVYDDFLELGGHSLLALRLWTRVKEALGRDYPVRLFFRQRTIAQMAQAIDEHTRTGQSRPIMAAQAHKRQARPPLVGVDDVAAVLAQHFESIPVCPVGFYSDEVLIKSIESLVERAKIYVARLRERQPQGPYLLVGLCGSALLAFEMARMLVDEGESVPLLILAEPASIVRVTGSPSLRRTMWLRYYRFRLQHHLSKLVKIPLLSWPGYVARRAAAFTFALGQAARIARPVGEHSDFWRERPELLRALKSYIPEPYSGKVTLVVAEQTVAIHGEPELGWRSVAEGGVDVRILPGDHHGLMGPDIRLLAEAIKIAYENHLERIEENP